MVVEIVISFAVMLGMAVILCVAAARGDIDGGELDDPVEEGEENNPSGADAPPPLAGEAFGGELYDAVEEDEEEKKEDGGEEE